MHDIQRLSLPAGSTYKNENVFSAADRAKTYTDGPFAGRPMYSMGGQKLTYKEPDFWPDVGHAIGESLDFWGLLGKSIPGIAREAYDHVGGLLKDTLRPEQQSGKFTGTAPISMPIKVDENGVVDTYNYDEDMSAPPEYNNAVPMVVNRNREVGVRPWVKDIGRSFNDILNQFTKPVEGSPTGETVLSIPLNTGTFPPDQSMVEEIPAYNVEAELMNAIDAERTDRQIGEGSTFGSQGPVDNPFVQNVGVHSLPPGARFGFDTTSLDTPNYQGLVTAVPEDRTLQDSLGYESGPGRFHSDLTYPDREANPEWGGLRDVAGGLLGGGNLVDMATGLVLGNPASAAMKVAKDDSLPAGRRIGAGVAAGAMTLANTLGGPAAGILGLLGGIFNSLGYHQDTDEVTGNISVSQGGTLSGDTRGYLDDMGLRSPGGPGFEQSGSLNNFNFFDALAATRPDEKVDYKGVSTNSAGARNLAGLEHSGIGGVRDAIYAGDATGGWGRYNDPGMTADNSGWGGGGSAQDAADQQASDDAFA